MVDTVGMQKIAEKGVEQVAEQGVEQGVARNAPAEDDVARFQEGLRAGEPAVAGNTQVAPGQVAGVAQSEGLGKTILDGLDKMRESRAQHMDNINNLAGKENMSAQDIYRLQFELAQITLQQDLSVKAADKANQGVQTLFKNQ